MKNLSVAICIAMIAIVAGCSGTSLPSTSPQLSADARASRAMQAGTAHDIPLTAVGLALNRGVTGPRYASAKRSAHITPLCPNIESWYAYYSGPPPGIWLWTKACSAVPVKCVSYCGDPWWLIELLELPKATQAPGWAVSYSNASKIGVNVLSKNWKTLGQLNDINATPLGMAEDATTGNLYVSQWPTNEILVFAAGSEYPTQTLTDSNLTSLYYVAVDKKGDVFVDGFGTAGESEVDEMPAGGTTFSATPISGTFPGSLAFDKKQNLYVDDQGNGTSGTISIYPPPYQTATSSFAYSGDNLQISIDAKNRYLLAANNFLQGSEVFSQPVVYSLPTGSVVETGTASAGYLYAVSFAKSSKP